MAENKNQHFVPQGYLKNFSPDPSCRTINILNLTNNISIGRASIRDQCSKSYYYGLDPIFERRIQTVEGLGLGEIKKAISFDSQIDTSKILIFTLFQHLRTDQFLRGEIENWRRMGDAIFGDNERSLGFEVSESPAIASRIAFSSLGKLYAAAKDLRRCLLVAKRGDSFITSDNPAYTVNKFLSQRKLGQMPGFGFSSSGFGLLMPLAPHLLFMAFDDNVYSVLEGGEQYLQVSSHDVDWLNAATAANSQNNIYYGNSPSLDTVQFVARKGLPLRVQERHRIHLLKMAPDRSRVGEKVFRGASLEEFRGEGRSLIVTRTEHVSYSRWPTFLRNKLRPKFVNTKTGAGIQRPTFIEPGE